MPRRRNDWLNWKEKRSQRSGDEIDWSELSDRKRFNMGRISRAREAGEKASFNTGAFKEARREARVAQRDSDEEWGNLKWFKAGRSS